MASPGTSRWQLTPTVAQSYTPTVRHLTPHRWDTFSKFQIGSAGSPKSSWLVANFVNSVSSAVVSLGLIWCHTKDWPLVRCLFRMFFVYNLRVGFWWTAHICDARPRSMRRVSTRMCFLSSYPHLSECGASNLVSWHPCILAINVTLNLCSLPPCMNVPLRFSRIIEIFTWA
jgi:hypothetical protein